MTEQLIIIGSVPAGYTAAIYAARAGLAPLVIARAVTSTTLTGHLKSAVTGAGQRFEAPAIILATGSAYKELGLEEEKKFSGHGVSWCATCDGSFFRDQDLVVVGRGDSAMEEATFLTRFAETVTVIVRRGELRASKNMAQRAKDNPEIRIMYNTAITAIHGHSKFTGVSVEDTATGDTRELAETGIFIAIGHLPRTELVVGQVELDDEGYIRVDAPTTVTNLSGVFACGDAVDHRYRQEPSRPPGPAVPRPWTPNGNSPRWRMPTASPPP